MSAYQHTIKKMKINYLNTNIMKSFLKSNPMNTRYGKTEPFKITGYKKMYWIGFGKELRENLPENLKILHAHTKKHGRLYTIIEKDKELDLVKTKKNNNLYENINPHRKFKIYFDFDLEMNQKEKPTAEQEKERIDIVLSKIKETLKTNNLAIDRTEPRKKNQKSWKLSYHIIVKDLYFNNLQELLDSGFKEWITEYMSDYGIDNIYTHYRWLKYPYQSKPDQPQQLPVEEPDDIRNHTATHFTGNEKHIDISLFKEFKKDFDNIDVKKMKKRMSCKNKTTSLHKKEYVLPDTFDLKYATTNEILFLIQPQKYTKRTMKMILEWYIKEKGSFKTWWNWNKQGNMWGFKNVDEWEDDEEVFYKEWKEYAIAMKKQDSTWIKRGGFIKALLERIYNTEIKNKSVEDFFNTFIKTGDIKVGEENEKGYLSYNELKRASDKQKYTLFNISMGGGKTYATMNYINEEQPKRILWITNRITLGRSIYGEINKMVYEEDDGSESHHTYKGEPFRFYKDVRGELNERYDEMNDENRRTTLKDINRLIIEVESMKHLINAEQYDLIVADEIESLFLPFMTDDTHGTSYDKNWGSFCDTMKDAKKVFLMDAYLSTRTTDFIKDNDPDEEQVIIYNKRSLNKTYRHYKHFKTMIKNIINDLKEGKRIYLFYPYKTGKGSLFKLSIEELCAVIVKDLPELNYLVYHGDIDDSEKKKLGDVNELWSDKQLIITNSTISVGVSYNNKDKLFDKIYLTYAEFIYPRDVIQSSFRVRTTTDNEIGYCELKSKGDIIGELKNKKEGLRSIYIMGEDKTLSNLMKNMSLEYLAKGNEGMRKFMELTGYEKTFINNEGVDDKEWKKMRKLTEGVKDLWDWDSIFYVDTKKHSNNIIKYKEKRDNQTATGQEKMEIEKYEVMRFLKPELFKCCDDPEEEAEEKKLARMDNTGREIYTKHFKAFNLVNRFLQGKDHQVLELVLERVFTNDNNKIEGFINQDYYIKLKNTKKWTKEDREIVFKYIQLDKRYMKRYSNQKLQQKIINSFGITPDNTGKEKIKEVMNDELLSQTEKDMRIQFIKKFEKKNNSLTSMGLGKIIEIFNNYGRRNHSIYEKDYLDELDFLSDDEDEVIPEPVIIKKPEPKSNDDKDNKIPDKYKKLFKEIDEEINNLREIDEYLESLKKRNLPFEEYCKLKNDFINNTEKVHDEEINNLREIDDYLENFLKEKNLPFEEHCKLKNDIINNKEILHDINIPDCKLKRTKIMKAFNEKSFEEYLKKMKECRKKIYSKY